MASTVIYQFYTDSYGGGLSEAAFSASLPTADAHVRWLCAVKGVTTCNVFKRAVCAALEAFAEYGAGEVGGYSIGEFSVNCRSIGIEIIGASEDFSEAEIAKAAWLTQRLQEKYGIPDANVIRHYDVTGKRCPAPYIEAGRWSRLKARLCGDGTWTRQGSGAGSGSAPTGSTQELACRVIAGEFGNGEERRRRLGSRYDEVQAEVSWMLAGGGAAPALVVDIDAIARDVIAGK